MSRITPKGKRGKKTKGVMRGQNNAKGKKLSTTTRSLSYLQESKAI